MCPLGKEKAVWSRIGSESVPRNESDAIEVCNRKELRNHRCNIKLEQAPPPPWDFKMLNFIRKWTCPNSATHAARIILLSWLSNRAEELACVEHSYKKGKQLINYVFPECDSTLCSQRHFPAVFSGAGNNHGFAQNCREDLSDQADTTTLKKQVN